MILNNSPPTVEPCYANKGRILRLGEDVVDYFTSVDGRIR